MDKVKESITNNKALLCIGYHLPDITIKKVNFTIPVYFTKSIFHGNVLLEDSIFDEEFDMSDTELLQETSFWMVRFTKTASFAEAKFNNKAEFRKITFQHTGIFRSIHFKEVIFLDVSFQHDVFFDYATVQERAHFGIREIRGEAGFSYVEFQDTTVFPKIEFHGKTDFSYSIFYSKTDFILVNFNEETKFHNVLFKAQEETLFDINNLSRVSFRGTDITKVRFTEKVVWGKSPKEKFKVIDELHLEKSIFPLFTWNNIPGKDEKKLKEFLKNKFVLKWLDIDTEVEKSNNDNTIIISSTNNNQKIFIEVYEDSKDTTAHVKLNNVLIYMFRVENQSARFIINRQKNRLVYDYSSNDIRLGTVLAIYRNLRENYEHRLRFDEAWKLLY